MSKQKQMTICEAIEVAREIAEDYQSTANNGRAYDCEAVAAIFERRVMALNLLIDWVETDIYAYEDQ